MSLVQSDDLSPPIRPPKCPACNKPMRLESASPDIRFSNLSHFHFKCDCGWNSDQLIAMRDRKIIDIAWTGELDLAGHDGMPRMWRDDAAVRNRGPSRHRRHPAKDFRVSPLRPRADPGRARRVDGKVGEWAPHNNAFDAETTRLLCAAFDAAWEAVLTSLTPLDDARQVAAVRELLAKHIIEMVRRGERNPQQLIENALRLLPLSPSAEIEAG